MCIKKFKLIDIFIYVNLKIKQIVIQIIAEFLISTKRICLELINCIWMIILAC